mgnify:CR=1 FL=1
MFAILSPDGTFRELRDGQVKTGDNTANRLKPYAVPVVDTRPAVAEGHRLVNERRVVTPSLVTLEADGVEIIPVPTEADTAGEHIKKDAFARGLVKLLANKFGMTQKQVVDAIKSQAEA